MSTNTPKRPKPLNKLCSGMTQTAITVVMAGLMMLVAALAQAGFSLVEVSKLLAEDGSAGDVFGFSVAISGDIAVIGAPGDDVNGLASGSAYIFVRTAGVWTQQVKLLTSAPGDNFGNSVAISGHTAIVGAQHDNDNGLQSGSAYVFTLDAGGSWTVAKLLPSDGTQSANFGISVAISGDTAVVGARFANGNAVQSGSAYVFTRDATGVWAQQAELLPHDGSLSDQFGISVSISGDTIVVGAFHDDDSCPGDLHCNSGSAYVFIRDPINDTWMRQAKLLSDNGAAGDGFGDFVALDGSRVIIGAPGDDDNGSISGSAYIFVRDKMGVWTQQAKLLPDDGAASDQFGSAVAINGNMVGVGAYGDDDNGSNSGSVYIFTTGTTDVWFQRAKILPRDGAAGDLFGITLALSGHSVIAGAYRDVNACPDMFCNSGSAYIYGLSERSHVDLNGDGVVDGADVAAFLLAWGCLAPANCQTDLNGDGMVNSSDLAILLGNWGPCP